MKKKVTKKQVMMIVNEIENWGECFIGTLAVQGDIVFKRYEKVSKAYAENHPNDTLAYDAVTGICWVTK